LKIWNLLYVILAVGLRPPRDHDTCPSSPWTIAWRVAISRISEEEF